MTKIPNNNKIGAFGALFTLIFNLKNFTGLRPAELRGGTTGVFFYFPKRVKWVADWSSWPLYLLRKSAKTPAASCTLSSRRDFWVVSTQGISTTTRITYSTYLNYCFVTFRYTFCRLQQFTPCSNYIIFRFTYFSVLINHPLLVLTCVLVFFSFLSFFGCLHVSTYQNYVTYFFVLASSIIDSPFMLYSTNTLVGRAPTHRFVFCSPAAWEFRNRNSTINAI